MSNWNYVTDLDIKERYLTRVLGMLPSRAARQHIAIQQAEIAARRDERAKIVAFLREDAESNRRCAAALEPDDSSREAFRWAATELDECAGAIERGDF